MDLREFARFILTGVTATVGNIAVVWLSRLRPDRYQAVWLRNVPISASVAS